MSAERNGATDVTRQVMLVIDTPSGDDMATSTSAVETCDYEQCPAVPDEMVSDEAGTYHESCYQEMVRAESAYWQAHFARSFAAHDVDPELAYEPNDPKNAVYVERLLEAIDAAIER